MADKKNTSKKTEKIKAPNLLLKAQVTGAVGISLIAALCFVYLIFIERPTVNTQQLQTIAQHQAQTQAVVIDQALQQLRKRLKSLSQVSAFKASMADNTMGASELFKQQLKHSFPEAASTLLIELGPLGIASLDTSTVSLNNIELDLLRRASNGEEVAPEAYQTKKGWVFSLAQPVQIEGEKFARAAFFIRLDASYIENLLAGGDASLGESALAQQFSHKTTPIARFGQSGGDVVATAKTMVPHWHISYAPSGKLRQSLLLNEISLWAALACIVVLAFVFAFITARKIKSELDRNLSSLGEGKSGKAYSLPGFAELSEVWSSGQNTVEKEKPEEKPEVPTPEVAVVEEEVIEQAQDDWAEQLPADLPAHIFRAYDIRGIAETELTDEIVHAIGMAIGSEALDQGQQKVVVAMDGRESSPQIKAAMIQGLQDSGRLVIDIGMVPTPLMYFATHHLGTQTGVMITGSHNPSEYNGIKIVIGGSALSGSAIAHLRDRVLSRQLVKGEGECQSGEVVEAYLDYIINDIAVAQPLKVVLDAGNGVAGVIAPRLFEELGCEVIPLYCDVDGSFPNHHPDPTVEANLEDLKAAIAEHNADLGIAFDGDGDRLGVVTATGQAVPADKLLMLLAQDVVSRNPGADILYDVKCTRNLNALISNYGGRPIMWKTGHSFMKEKMAETGALLGGEFSGHIFFKERWFGFDDGLYAGTRLIEILSTTDPDLDVQLEAFPASIGSPELKVESDDEQKFTVIEQLAARGEFGDGKVTTLDGVRVDFADGWGLVRASNTTPMLILRFEADTEEAMERIQSLFKDQLSNIDNSLQFGF